MAVSVVNTWSAAWVLPASTTSNPPPGTISLPVSVANTSGNWLFAVIGWQNVAGFPPPLFTVADDAHNWWEPADAGSSASSSSGLTSTAVWMAPAAGAAAVVYAAPTAYTTAYAVTVYEVSGLLPWVMTSAASGFLNASSPLTVNLGAPAAQSFEITAAANNGSAAHPPAIGGGAGWSSATVINGSNGSDDTEDINVASAWQVTSGATSAVWSSSPSNVSAVTIAAAVAAPAPSRASPFWPVTYLELAPGAGFHSPPDDVTWTTATSRYLNLSMTQGRQYELAALSAGEGTLTLDNPDEALLPPGTGQFAGITSGTPVRLRCAWTGGAWQVSFTGDGATANPQASTGALFLVTAGLAYTASAWLACSAPWAAGVDVVLAWYTSGNTLISSVTSAVVVTGTVAGLALATGTAPGTAAYAAVIIQANGTPPSTTTFYASAAPTIT